MKSRIVGIALVGLGLFNIVAMAASAPKVAKTSPPADATDVDPGLTEIVVEFDTPVKMNSWSVVYVDGAELPEMVGDAPIDFRDNRTCVMKVKLAPDTAYGIAFNSETRQGFKAAEDETPAVPFVLRFKTGSGKSAAGPEGPRVVRSEPADGARDLEPGTFDLVLVFNEPMKDAPPVLATPAEAPPLKTLGAPRWKDARTAVIPVMLAPKTTYKIGINVGEDKPFVSAGDSTPALPLTITFSTVGAEPTKPPAPAGAVAIRYNYQKGDTGRAIQRTNLDVKLDVGNGMTVPIGQKVGVNGIEEVLAVEEGKPVEVRKMIAEFLMLATNPETGKTEAAPRLEQGVVVKIDRRGDEPRVTPVDGEVPEPLMLALSEDEFLDLLPQRTVKVGDSFPPPTATMESIRKAFDVSGQGSLHFVLTCRRIGPVDVDDARNAMFKAQGSGQPITYVFNAAEFDIDWKQDGKMENNIPFSLEAKGKIVFAIDAGVYLRISADGKITVKPVQLQDDNGQMVTVSGGGTYQTEMTYEPIDWSRGVQRKGQADKAPSTASPLGTPRGSIEHQFNLLKKGDAAALRACFVEKVRDLVTDEVVEKGQADSKDYTLDELVAEVIEGERDGTKTARILMKGDRTLTTLVLTDGKWLAETVWFK
ncbi:MAG: Ig-like domain-containing protein [Phycisphaerae bacterium]|nr:Ig-like domain-containing protein [Phycisphaerae bacterium]